MVSEKYGKITNDYNLLEPPLGTGAFGEVRKAVHRGTGMSRAVKIIDKKMANADEIEKLINEVEVMKKLDHPHIVKVYEYYQDPKFFYIVSEICSGGELFDRIKVDEGTEEETARKYFKQLLNGVAFCHLRGICHRDLKPENLLLANEGDEAILKIADFGLAREYGSPLNDYTQVVVTLWYRCPELLLGQKRYSTYIDIWSCGCIMGEFLQGKPLFPGKTEQEQVKLIFKELGTPDDKIWPGFSDLPHAKKVQWERHPHNMLRKRYKDEITKTGYDLMKGLLCYSPEDRMTARQALEFMERRWFQESPIPTPREYFPTWPAKSELNAIRAKSGITMPSPDAPTGAAQFNEILKSSMGNM